MAHYRQKVRLCPVCGLRKVSGAFMFGHIIENQDSPQEFLTDIQHFLYADIKYSQARNGR